MGFKKIFLSLSIFEREHKWRRGREREREREREGDRESKQAAGSRLRAISAEPYAGLELTDHELVT